MRTYEVTFRFRTDVEPRADITTEQVQDRVVPYVFPRHGGQVVVLGSTMTRIDNERNTRTPVERVRALANEWDALGATDCAYHWDRLAGFITAALDEREADK